jgi:hypothetical protein
MNIATALRLKDSFVRTAARDLAEERFPGLADDVIKLVEEALIIAQKDLNKHIPAVDSKAEADLKAVGVLTS